MKQDLTDLMSAMMPAMLPLVWLGGAMLALGILFLVLGRRRLARWPAGLATVVGVFFLAAQGLGKLLGARPSINFGDPRQMEFVLVPFWQIGLFLLVPALLIGLLAEKGRRRRGS